MEGRKSCQQSPKYNRLASPIQREMAEKYRVSRFFTCRPTGPGRSIGGRRRNLSTSIPTGCAGIPRSNDLGRCWKPLVGN